LNDRRPSIKDVARVAGVSTATVSRALANPEKVVEPTRNKVQAAVLETGYIANAMASNLRRRQTDTVLVLVSDIANPFYSNIIQGIERIAHRHNFRILLGDTQQQAEREQSYVNLVLQKQADGIISLSRQLPFQISRGQKQADPDWPPVVMACEYYGDVDVPVVRIDNCTAAYEAALYLLQLGHRRIAYIDGPEEFPICAERRAGYERALTEAGIKPEQRLEVEGDFSLQSGGGAMHRLLSTASRPTAVFAANDEMAIGAIKAIKAAGLSVPEDISVMGFDDIGFAEYCDPPLTTVHQPRNRMGETLMQVMLGILDGETPERTEILLPHRLVLRESTAPPLIFD
jgi:LacI family transcriptional regulator, repressor for deo operon, udp, cdd, tsx, nupC, and nupG